MHPGSSAAGTEDPLRIEIFCSREGEAWRVYVRPTRLPRYLAPCLDRHGEAYPVLLDFEDLDRQLGASRASCEQRASTAGGMELTARGPAAAVLARWLATAFASGVRPGPAR